MGGVRENLPDPRLLPGPVPVGLDPHLMKVGVEFLEFMSSTSP